MAEENVPQLPVAPSSSPSPAAASPTSQAASPSAAAPPPVSQTELSPVRPDLVNVSVEALALLICITLLSIIVALVIHHVLRHKIKHVFAARCKVKRPIFPEPAKWPLAWVRSVIKIDEEKLLQHNGLDCVLYLRFLLLGLKLTGFCALVVPPIIVPINTVGIEVSPEVAGLNRFTLSNIPNESSRITVHLVFTYLITFFAMKLFYDEYECYMNLRHRCLANRDIQSRTVLIRDLPQELQDDRALAKFVTSLGIGDVQAVHVAHHYYENPKKRVRARLAALRGLEKELIWIGQQLCRQADALVKDLAAQAPGRVLAPREQALLNLHKECSGKAVAEMNIWRFVFFDPEIKRLIHERYTRRYSIIWFPWERHNTSALAHHISEFTRLDQEICDMHERWKREATSDAFVVFTGHKAAQIATQTVLCPKPFTLSAQMAPEPRDVFWENLGLRTYQQSIRKYLGSAAVAVTTFFWLIPLVPIAALTTIESLGQRWPQLATWTKGSDIARILLKSVPILLLQLAMVCVPMVFEVLTRMEKPESRATLERKVTSKTYFFLMFNILFLFTIGVSIVTTVSEAIEKPLWVIFTTLASNLAFNAVFYSNYILLSTIFSALYILNYNSLFWSVIFARIVSNTPRDLWVWHLPLPPCYYYLYPYHLLVLAIALTYSTIYPFILIFAAFYFGVTFTVQANNFMFVYKPNYESGGKMWPMVFDRLICGLVVYQLTMTGIFALRSAITNAGFSSFLVVLTLAFKVYCTKAFRKRSDALPLTFVSDASNVLPETGPLVGTGANGVMPNGPEGLAFLTESLQRLVNYQSRESLRQQLRPQMPTDSELDDEEAMARWDKQELQERIRNQTYRPTALVKCLPSKLWLPRDPTKMWKLELKATIQVRFESAVTFLDPLSPGDAELGVSGELRNSIPLAQAERHVPTKRQSIRSLIRAGGMVDELEVEPSSDADLRAGENVGQSRGNLRSLTVNSAAYPAPFELETPVDNPDDFVDERTPEEPSGVITTDGTMGSSVGQADEKMLMPPPPREDPPPDLRHLPNGQQWPYDESEIPEKIAGL